MVKGQGKNAGLSTNDVSSIYLDLFAGKLLNLVQ